MLFHTLWALIVCALIANIHINKRVKYIYFIATLFLLLFFYIISSLEVKNMLLSAHKEEKESFENFLSENTGNYVYVIQKTDDISELFLSTKNPVRVCFLQKNKSFVFIELKLTENLKERRIFCTWNELGKYSKTKMESQYVINKFFSACTLYNNSEENSRQTVLLIPSNKDPNLLLFSVINNYVDNETIMLMSNDNDLLFTSKEKIFLLKIRI